MRVGVPREIAPRETRVALVPETVARLIKAGVEVSVESGAGDAASFRDDAYTAAGATIAPDAQTLYGSADVVLKVREPLPEECDLLRPGTLLVALLGRDPESPIAQRLAARGVTAYAMERIPRTSRAQSMDALSSMATVAGYRAVLHAATALGKFFPLLMTAAGTIAPSRVLVLGAGVAGLQAIAASRRLGAVVEAFDVRPAVKEEVESLGATFLAPDLVQSSAVADGGYAKALSDEQHAREVEVIRGRLDKVDAVITTAQIPGKSAPRLITEDMVRGMRPGSVIVDCAAESGGNCELTVAGERVEKHGVIILGPVNLPAELPVHASQMYSRNIAALLVHLVKDGRLALDADDEITRETCLVRPVAAGRTAQ